MSIRGRGPHDVWIQRRKPVREKGYTGYQDYGPVVFNPRVDVQSVREWATSEEYYEHGLRLINMVRCFARDWVGDENAIVYFRGSRYEVIGNPQLRDRTRRTKHWVISLKWLGEHEMPDPEAAVHIDDVLKVVSDG